METSDIRAEFPFFRKVKSECGQPIVYFDNAATSLKPKCVVDKVSQYYLETSANVHRGVHQLSESATREFEGTRTEIQSLLGANHAEEIVLTSGATHGLNLVALGWARQHLKSGDEILLTEMEHHANIVPWHLLQREKDIQLRFVPVQKDGTLDLSRLESLVSRNTRLASFVMTSNVLGTINPTREIISRLKAINPGIHIVLDGAQAAAHEKLDVCELGCSALTLSAHKMCGPTGVGALYLRQDFRDEFSPVMGGGDMINKVTLEGSTFAPFPSILEPGTPNIAGVIGFGEAIRFLKRVGFSTVQKQEQKLLEKTSQMLAEIKGLRLVGHNTHKSPVFSFEIEGAHSHDVATVLDKYGIAVRSGHHCAQPLMKALGVVSTARASLNFYNSEEEVDRFAEALIKTRELVQ